MECQSAVQRYLHCKNGCRRIQFASIFYRIDGTAKQIGYKDTSVEIPSQDRNVQREGSTDLGQGAGTIAPIVHRQNRRSSPYRVASGESRLNILLGKRWKDPVGQSRFDLVGNASHEWCDQRAIGSWSISFAIFKISSWVSLITYSGVLVPAVIPTCFFP